MSDFLTGVLIGVMLIPSVVGAFEIWKWYSKPKGKRKKVKKE